MGSFCLVVGTELILRANAVAAFAALVSAQLPPVPQAAWLPTWTPTWAMNSSTIAMTCTNDAAPIINNANGLGIVDFDWCVFYKTHKAS